MNFLFMKLFTKYKKSYCPKVKNRNEVLEKPEFPFSFLPV